MAKSSSYFLSVSGVDHPGITARLTHLMQEKGIEILDIGQSLMHGLLSLSFKIEWTGKFAELKEFFNELNLEDSLSWYLHPISERSHQAPLEQKQYLLLCQGKNRLNPAYLHHITNTLAARKVNILRISNKEYGGLSLLELTLVNTTSDLDWADCQKELIEMAHQHQIDLSFIPNDIWRQHRRVIVFDMDSTFIQGEVINEMAEEFNLASKISEITTRAMNGEIDFKESLTQRVSHLKGLTLADLKKVRDRIELNPGVTEAVTVLKKLGYKVGIISGGFTYFSHYLKKELDLDFAFSNELELENDTLTGKVQGTIIDAEEKAKLIDHLANLYDVDRKQIVAIGDGANDIPMLMKAGMGIAFQAKATVKEKSDHQVNFGSMHNLLPMLGLSPEQVSLLLKGNRYAV